MTRTGRSILVVIGIAVLGLAGTTGWMLFFQPSRPVELTQAQIDGVIAVEKDMKDLAGKVPSSDAGFLEQAKQTYAFGKGMVEIEKRHGFNDPIAFVAIINAVLLVQNGIDPATKTYGGATYLRKEIALLEANDSLSAADRAQSIKYFRGQLETTLAAEPVPAGNIELVVKNYDRLREALAAAGG